MAIKLQQTLKTVMIFSLFWGGFAQASSTPDQDLKALPERTSMTGERMFVFSPHLKQWAAYDKDGYRVASGKANGGANHCKDTNRACRTPIGDFKIYRQRGANCKSSKYPLKTNGGAAMPYCMFFKGGVAIHGSDYIGDRNSSHGCVRVQTAAAEWLQRDFIQIGTKVVVLPY